MLKAVIVGVGTVAGKDSAEDRGTEEFIHVGCEEAAIVVGPAPSVRRGLWGVAGFLVDEACAFQDGLEDEIAKPSGKVRVVETEEEQVFCAEYRTGECAGAALISVKPRLETEGREACFFSVPVWREQKFAEVFQAALYAIEKAGEFRLIVGRLIEPPRPAVPGVLRFEDVVKLLDAGVLMLGKRGKTFGEKAASDDFLRLIVVGFIQADAPSMFASEAPEIFRDAEFIKDGLVGVENIEGQLRNGGAEGVLGGKILIIPELLEVEGGEAAVGVGFGKQTAGLGEVVSGG